MRINNVSGLLEGVKRVYEPKKTKFSVESFQEMEANLETTCTSQKALGLGNPEQAQRLLKTSLKAVMGAQEANDLAQVACVQYIEDPTTSIDLFEVVNNTTTMSSSKRYKEPPELVISKLTADTREVLCTLSDNNTQKKAAIPVIPAIIQEIASRAKAAAPSAEFFVAFQASWEPAPMKDPALLARIKDSQNNTAHWFMIGDAWGGDKALVEDHLVSKRTEA